MGSKIIKKDRKKSKKLVYGIVCLVLVVLLAGFGIFYCIKWKGYKNLPRNYTLTQTLAPNDRLIKDVNSTTSSNVWYDYTADIEITSNSLIVSLGIENKDDEYYDDNNTYDKAKIGSFFYKLDVKASGKYYYEKVMKDRKERFPDKTEEELSLENHPLFVPFIDCTYSDSINPFDDGSEMTYYIRHYTIKVYCDDAGDSVRYANQKIEIGLPDWFKYKNIFVNAKNGFQLKKSIDVENINVEGVKNRFVSVCGLENQTKPTNLTVKAENSTISLSESENGGWGVYDTITINNSKKSTIKLASKKKLNVKNDIILNGDEMTVLVENQIAYTSYSPNLTINATKSLKFSASNKCSGLSSNFIFNSPVIDLGDFSGGMMNCKIECDNLKYNSDLISFKNLKIIADKIDLKCNEFGLYSKEFDCNLKVKTGNINIGEIYRNVKIETDNAKIVIDRVYYGKADLDIVFNQNADLKINNLGSWAKFNLTCKANGNCEINNVASIHRDSYSYLFQQHKFDLGNCKAKISFDNNEGQVNYIRGMIFDDRASVNLINRSSQDLLNERLLIENENRKYSMLSNDGTTYFEPDIVFVGSGNYTVTLELAKSFSYRAYLREITITN